MMTSEPIYCRPEAYRLFASQLAAIDTSSGLLRATLAISMHAMERVDVQETDQRLHELAGRVLFRLRNRHVQALLAHLHDVLFDEEGFRGNEDDYYNPHNCYLPSVLETRRGIPITLALVYKIVAERIGLGVVGVNSPGHFLVRVRDDRQWMIIDPYSGGDVLTPEEAYSRIETLTGGTIARQPRSLPTASHAEWLSRILANLQHIFAAEHQHEDLAAMNELQTLLRQTVMQQ